MPSIIIFIFSLKGWQRLGNVARAARLFSSYAVSFPNNNIEMIENENSENENKDENKERKIVWAGISTEL